MYNFFIILFDFIDNTQHTDTVTFPLIVAVNCGRSVDADVTQRSVQQILMSTELIQLSA